MKKKSTPGAPLGETATESPGSAPLHVNVFYGETATPSISHPVDDALICRILQERAHRAAELQEHEPGRYYAETEEWDETHARIYDPVPDYTMLDPGLLGERSGWVHVTFVQAWLILAVATAVPAGALMTTLAQMGVAFGWLWGFALLLVVLGTFLSAGISRHAVYGEWDRAFLVGCAGMLHGIGLGVLCTALTTTLVALAGTSFVPPFTLSVLYGCGASLVILASLLPIKRYPWK